MHTDATDSPMFSLAPILPMFDVRCANQPNSDDDDDDDDDDDVAIDNDVCVCVCSRTNHTYLVRSIRRRWPL